MELTLNLNSRLQPMHRHDLEDALQEILEKINLGEVMGGGTLQNPQTGEIESCDIEIHLNDDKQDKLESPVTSEISENNSDVVSNEKATKKRKKKK